MKNKEKVSIEKVFQREQDSLAPVMLNFENGRLSAFVKDDIYFGRLQDKKHSHQVTGRLIVNGNTFEGPLNSSTTDASDSPLTDNYICVRNRKTNKMRIIPIECVQLRNTVYQRLAREQKQFEFTEEVSRKTLLKKFGGRKAMRALRGREELNMKVEVVQDDLQAEVDTSILEEDDPNESILNIAQNAVYFDSIRPPYDAAATNTRALYQFQTIISTQILSQLEEDAKVILQMRPNEIPVNCPALVEKIVALQKVTASPTSILHVQVIVYMDCLLAIIQSRAKSMEQVDLNASGKKILMHFYREFIDPKISVGFSRTKFSYEKALCYYLVLSIMLQPKMQANIDELSQELKTSKQKIIQYGRVVFAMPRQRKTQLVLQLPSKVPPLPTGQRRRRAIPM